MIYHLIKIQKLSAGIFLILQQGIRVLKSPYINKSFFLLQGGGDFWGRSKNQFFKVKKNPLKAAEPKKERKENFLPFQFSSVQNQTQIKSKVSFSSSFLLKTVI